MSKKLQTVLLGIFTLALSTMLLAVEADKKGATPGKWTMDFEAAKKLAKEKKLPILLDFSGSDWCGWCKLMEKNVFSQKKWQDYAKNNIIMVLIDSPKDKSLVPKEYVERNEKLKEEYGVQGFPTFMVLAEDGDTVLGKLGASQSASPASFIGDLEKLFRYRPATVAKYAAKLKPKEKSEYLKLVKDISDCEKKLETNKKQIAEAEKQIMTLEKQEMELKEKASEFRAKQLGPEQLKKFKKLKADLETAKKEMTDWIATKPDRSQENMQKYQSMMMKLQKISEELSAY